MAMKSDPTDGLQEATRWIVDTWCTYFREVLEAMTFEQAKVAMLDSSQSKSAGEEPIVWWKQTLSYPEGAAVWVGATATVSTFVGNKVLSAAGVDENEPDLIRRTYQEVVQQATPALARVLGSKFEREVTSNEGQEDPAGPTTAGQWIEVRFPNEKPARLIVAVHPSLAEFISSVDQFASASKHPAKAPRLNGDVNMALAVPEPPETGQTKTIDLLLDVELPVSVSFGRAYMPLKEVFRLTSGSIVELNRPIADPVEVIVNNCVIARGEVVVIDGNYGVRIQQIISRRDRLRTLT